jgi:hypothetical protein
MKVKVEVTIPEGKFCGPCQYFREYCGHGNCWLYGKRVYFKYLPKSPALEGNRAYI